MMAGFEPRMTGDFEPQGYRLVAIVVLAWGIGVGIAILVKGGDVILALSLMVVGVVVYAALRAILAVEANTHRAQESFRQVVRSLERTAGELEQVKNSILLSEDAKSIAFREKDREALRQAIEEELARKDWEAARYLADQMEKRFGYREAAAQVRERIEGTQAKQHEQDVAVVLARIGDSLAAHDWDQAQEQISEAQKQFADDTEINALPDRLEQAKVQRKKQLLQQWDQAVQKDQVDRGIEILKELDGYLTANEVAALEESARGVFRAKLHNLGIQFSMLVTEKVWDKALEVAEEIVNEFPNSRMAAEIRERMAALTAKAGVE